MEEIKIQFSRNQIKKIGKKIKNKEELSNEEEQILSEWLNRHFKIMDQMRQHLYARIKQAGLQDYFIAKRTKRLDSIQYKLIRYPHLQLDTIQDIAGMRIVCSNLSDARKLINNMQKHYKKNNEVFEFTEKIDDYIKKPKEDGYRSCHLILKHKENGYFIEIQVRTKTQHEWATAVEILDMQKQSKIKQGMGECIYKEFFKLCSAIFSHLEETNILEKYKNVNLSTICYLLYKLNKKHQIIETLEGLTVANDYIEKNKKGFFFVIALDTIKKEIAIFPFQNNKLQEAREHYNKMEKGENLNVVLISLDDCNLIKEAYPNYYLDSEKFISKLQTIMTKNQVSFLKKFLLFFKWRKWYYDLKKSG